MSTRKLIKGDRYRAGLWKLEERCYEGHVRMPNAKTGGGNGPRNCRTADTAAGVWDRALLGSIEW